jgi:hypothetical protein
MRSQPAGGIYILILYIVIDQDLRFILPRFGRLDGINVYGGGLPTKIYDGGRDGWLIAGYPWVYK